MWRKLRKTPAKHVPCPDQVNPVKRFLAACNGSIACLNRCHIGSDAIPIGSEKVLPGKTLGNPSITK
jgi:hypothetical protein